MGSDHLYVGLFPPRNRFLQESRDPPSHDRSARDDMDYDVLHRQRRDRVFWECRLVSPPPETFVALGTSATGVLLCIHRHLRNLLYLVDRMGSHVVVVAWRSTLLLRHCCLQRKNGFR